MRPLTTDPGLGRHDGADSRRDHRMRPRRCGGGRVPGAGDDPGDERRRNRPVCAHSHDSQHTDDQPQTASEEPPRLRPSGQPRTTAMSLSRTLVAAGLLAAAHTSTAAALTISKAKLFQNPAKTAICGIEIHLTPRPTEVLCSARGVPRPKGRAGDPYVQIAATGRPRLILVSQDSYVTNTLTTLSTGTLWRSLGVSCSIGTSTILCFNRNNHGFLIGKRAYRAF